MELGLPSRRQLLRLHVAAVPAPAQRDRATWFLVGPIPPAQHLQWPWVGSHPVSWREWEGGLCPQPVPWARSSHAERGAQDAGSAAAGQLQPEAAWLGAQRHGLRGEAASLWAAGRPGVVLAFALGPAEPGVRAGEWCGCCRLPWGWVLC